MRLVALGSTFDVRCPTEELRCAVAALWCRCLSEGTPATEPIDVHVDDEGDAQRVLLTRITTESIAGLAGEALMVHAAGVADPVGRVAALVGPSGSGKTTAAIRLSRRRFSYVTDETVAVEDDGTVLPFPRPLAVFDRGLGEKVVRSPDDLGLQPVEGSLRLARLLILNRQGDRGTDSRFDELDLLSGMSEVIPQMSALPALDRPLQRLAELIDRCGGVYRFSFSALGDEEAQALQDLLDAELEAKDSWQPLDRPVDDDIARNLGLLDTRIRRGGVLDGIRVDDEALLMVGATPIRLSALGLTIWEAAADAPTFDELVERIVAEHGPHPDAAQLVREAVDAMVGAKVLGYGHPVTVQQFLVSMPPQLAPASGDACCGGGA